MKMSGVVPQKDGWMDGDPSPKKARSPKKDGWMDGWRSVSKANKLAVTEND